MNFDFNYKEETLCKELAECIVQTPAGPMIKHHFINISYRSEPHIKDFENGQWNEVLRQKKMLNKGYLSENDFESISWLIERPWRIAWLFENKELVCSKVGLDKYYEILGDVFNDTESAHIHKSKLLKLFYFGENPLLMMNEDELKEYKELPNVIKVWRGVSSGENVQESNLLGFSWTLDFEKAKWFAARRPLLKNPYPLIFGLEVKKEEVLSFLTRRNESEIILDYTKIQLDRVEFLYSPFTEINDLDEVDAVLFEREK